MRPDNSGCSETTVYENHLVVVTDLRAKKTPVKRCTHNIPVGTYFTGTIRGFSDYTGLFFKSGGGITTMVGPAARFWNNNTEIENYFAVRVEVIIKENL